MKTIFYLSLIVLLLFEAANVFFIMPMPGSQQIKSLDTAYFLYQWRWVFRGVCGAGAGIGFLAAFRHSWWLASLAVLALGVVVYMANFEMAADKMFYQPRTLLLKDMATNTVDQNKLVLGIALNGQAKAYPIQFLGYHHQVLDTVGGEPVMVTYCTVCRTGRVYAPNVNGRPEVFRLVGMDHFNAMFEDATTHSWWRQATGECVAGPLAGTLLPELPATQTGLATWIKLYPNSFVMQPDSVFASEYADMDSYDVGLNRGKLTTTDTLSWHDKSWVVGIAVDEKTARAFDWNRLKQERIINEMVGKTPVVLVLADDNKSFFAWQRPAMDVVFTLENDRLHCGEKSWDLLGNALSPGEQPLQRMNAYQEFWHSWSTFHPHTTRY